MRSDDLTRDQLEALHARLAPTLAYLSKLVNRINELGYDPHDKLHQDVGKAQRAMHSLGNAIHYLGCDGVGRRRRG